MNQRTITPFQLSTALLVTFRSSLSMAGMCSHDCPKLRALLSESCSSFSYSFLTFTFSFKQIGIFLFLNSVWYSVIKRGVLNLLTRTMQYEVVVCVVPHHRETNIHTWFSPTSNSMAFCLLLIFIPRFLKNATVLTEVSWLKHFMLKGRKGEQTERKVSVYVYKIKEKIWQSKG